MKILITGGSGFLGSHVADELSEKGHKVTIFDKKKSKWLRKNQKFFAGNILDFNKTAKAIKGSKVVFHLAALSDLQDAMHKPQETVKNNILGTVNILELSKKYGVKRVIYASSIYSMSSQGGFYRCSKKAAEDYIEEYYKRYGLNFSVVRYGSLYGLRTNRSNGVFRTIDDALEREKIQYTGNKKALRRYLHVIDAAKATVDIMSPRYKNKYVNILGAKIYKVTQLFDIIFRTLNIKQNVTFLNAQALNYIKFPKIFRLRTGINYKIKKYTKFSHGINSLVKNMKKNRKRLN